MKKYFLLLTATLVCISLLEGFAQPNNSAPADSGKKWSYHFQVTTIYQMHPAFHALYSGPNSLNSNQEDALSLTTTIFFGRRLWKGAVFYVNPEIAGGKGLSGAMGVGGEFNGETFKIGNPSPTPYFARILLRQNFAIGKSNRMHVDNGINQLNDEIPESRLVISAGKFCIADYYDDNKFSHDCRTQFMNWSLMDNTGWDYPSNTRGYTWGMVAEFFRPKWAARISSVLVPTEPNGMELDENFTKAHSETFEAERKLSFGKHSGKIRLLLYHTISKAPNYRDAINAMSHGDSSLIPIFEGKQEWDTYGGQKYGYGISFDHEITDNIGFFARTSWNDGHTSIWAFTEVDQSVSGGISICMKKLKRPDDNLGIAFAVDDISNDHRDYLNAGGKTFDLGDGKLTRYGLEQIIETYYRCRLHQTLWLSLGYQYMINPGYNKDRGPVNVVSVRVHAEI